MVVGLFVIFSDDVKTISNSSGGGDADEAELVARVVLVLISVMESRRLLISVYGVGKNGSSDGGNIAVIILLVVVGGDGA
ncbi:Hypothetical predicted protein [Octopus vulgaris]|uniref:Uncharacterized protein n=1 Tax=Octopus vulgaris TaxID=6645 RepID=A0AA36ALU0_OCTVU|nr:Hypothetical predicted protein [Octopus vulgaris]